MMIEVSIVIPVYYGAKTIKKLVDNIEKTIVDISHEIILVNDGSKDNSEEVCRNLSLSKDNIKFINLRKNFGEFNAVMCGLNHAIGEYTVIIDDDFQNPPTEIIKLFNKAKEGDFDVVYSYYDSKKHHWVRNLGSNLINYFTTFLLKKPKDLYLSSFKIIKKEVIEEIIKFKGPNPYIDGLIFQVTDNIGKEKVLHLDRDNGSSTYTIKKLISLFLTIIFGYSLLPLRLTFLAGFISIVFSLIYMALYALAVIPEWGSPIVIFMCGCILCSIALVGEYIGASFMQLNGKPQYIIKSIQKKE
jgi:glycosyltransferase involved in cell wall biosynthesis